MFLLDGDRAEELFNFALSNLVNRFEFFFNDYSFKVHAMPNLIQSIIVELEPKMYY